MDAGGEALAARAIGSWAILSLRTEAEVNLQAHFHRSLSQIPRSRARDDELDDTQARNMKESSPGAGSMLI